MRQTITIEYESDNDRPYVFVGEQVAVLHGGNPSRLRAVVVTIEATDE